MKKRIVMGSVIVALLMLVSTQIIFIKEVKSEPTPHEGDAYAGTFWLTELDVSGDLQTIDYIGVPHVNATDDWVVWPTGEGDVIANWSVDIEGNHPEYWVIFSIGVFNVDDNNIAISHDCFQKSYNADTDYHETGSLTCNVNFTTGQKYSGEQTIVCHLGALVQINDTSEAEDFTIWSEDRCIIGFDFEWPRDEPFSDFIVESNDNFEPFFSYIDGWDDPGRFTSEDDMLNEQTLVMQSELPSDPPDYLYDWNLGKIDFYEDWSSYWDLDDSTFTPAVFTKKWGPVESIVSGYARLRWEVHANEGDIHIQCVWKLRIKDPPDEYGRATKMNYFSWEPGEDTTGVEIACIRVPISHDDPNGDQDGNISISGTIHAWTIFLWKTKTFNLDEVGYKIKYSDEEPPEYEEETTMEWYEKLAYNSGPCNISFSGTSPIIVDISEALLQDGKLLYIFSGDTGETKVTLTT